MRRCAGLLRTSRAPAERAALNRLQKRPIATGFYPCFHQIPHDTFILTRVDRVSHQASVCQLPVWFGGAGRWLGHRPAMLGDNRSLRFQIVEDGETPLLEAVRIDLFQVLFYMWNGLIVHF